MSAPMCCSLHSPLQPSHKASVVTPPLPFWLLFPPPLGVTFSTFSFLYARQTLIATASICWGELSLLWCITQPRELEILAPPLQRLEQTVQSVNQGWVRLREFLSFVQAQSDPDHITTFSLCPSASKNQTRYHLLLYSQPTNCQVSSFLLFIYFFILFYFAVSAFFPLWSFSASLVLLMCCSIFVLTGFEVAFRACSSLIQDLDMMHTKELKRGQTVSIGVFLAYSSSFSFVFIHYPL